MTIKKGDRVQLKEDQHAKGSVQSVKDKVATVMWDKPANAPEACDPIVGDDHVDALVKI